MKTMLIISLLCLGALSSNAQYEFQYSTKDHPPLKADAKPIPVRPAFDGPYTVVTDTPCTMYKRHDGLYIVNCPGIYFPPEHESAALTNVNPPAIETEHGMRVEREKAYSGYYPDFYKEYPGMPANAVPAYPTGPYVQLQDPPCYKYINKHGLEIMECPGAQFPPEHDR